MYMALKLAWSIIAASLIFLILLHSPKGDGLGGIGGQAQLFSSTKSAETTLNRLTWTLTVLFLGLTLTLSANWIPNVATTPSSNSGNSTLVQPTAPQIPTELPASSNSAPVPTAPAIPATKP